jgi:uncharacterized membrane protein
MPPLVPTLALCSAVLTAAATILIRQGLRGSDPYTAFWINCTVGVVGMWLAVLLTGGIGEVSARGVLLFAAAGIIGTVAGRLTRFMGIAKVGASISSAVGNLTPLIATIFAILLLGERVTAPVIAGTLVIVVGTVLLSSSGLHLGFQPWMVVFPLASAVFFGIVQVIRKIALGGVGPIPGTAINLTTAFIAFSAIMLALRHRGIYNLRARTLLYLVLAGLAENTGVFLMIVALRYGAVSVVTPLTAAAPIFVLLFTPFFLRGVEVLTPRVVAGTVLIVIGVYLVIV